MLAFLVIFVGGSVIFVGASEWMIRTIVGPNDAFAVYRHQLHGASAPTAAFGDSHVAAGIENNAEVANLGYPGETLALMLDKALYYTRSGKARRVILQLSPEQFAIYRADDTQRELAQALFSDTGPLLSMRPDVRRYLLAYWNATIRDPVGMLRPKAAKAAEGAARPVRLTDMPPEAQDRQAGIRVQLHTPLPPGPKIDRMLSAIAAALDELRGRNVEVCMVRYPLSAPYRRAAEKAPTFRSLYDAIEKLARARKAHVIDLEKYSDDGDFADADHLGDWVKPQLTRHILNSCFARAHPSA